MARPPLFIELSRFTRESLLSLSALFFPWRCPGCGRLLPYPKAICESCLSLLKRTGEHFCKRCGNPFPEEWKVKICAECKTQKSPLKKTRSAFLYEGLAQGMIREAKYGGRIRFLRFCAEELYVRAWSEFDGKVEALVPVPLHPAREWERKLNQAEFLAREISRISGVPVLTALEKIKKTAPQSSLSGTARRANLGGAFRVHPGIHLPRSVLLIDDVLTTGATLRECATVLRLHGVRSVYGLTIARAVKQ